MIAQGTTQQEVLAAKLTAPYDAKVPGGLLPAAGSGRAPTGSSARSIRN